MPELWDPGMERETPFTGAISLGVEFVFLFFPIHFFLWEVGARPHLSVLPGPTCAPPAPHVPPQPFVLVGEPQILPALVPCLNGFRSEHHVLPVVVKFFVGVGG